MKIFVATHKEYEFPNDSLYCPIQVGAKINNKMDRVLSDDSGENISDKNPYYCELTALYWLWKNVEDDVVGLVHYRRYFGSDDSNILINGHRIIDGRYLQCLNNSVDILLPERVSLSKKYRNVFWHYYDGHHIQDLLKVRVLLKNKFPEYFESFEHVMRQDSLYICNMFVAKKCVIDKYCEWIFDVLFSLESHIDLKNYTQYQKRVYGFLSERLFNVWLHKNNELFTVKNCKVVNIDAISQEAEMSLSFSMISAKVENKLRAIYQRGSRLIFNRLYYIKNDIDY